MIDGPFAYAFSLGLLAAVNPCGFAMLPAYLSYFLGLEEDADADRSVLRALAVGLTVTTGFVAVFAVIGYVIENVSGQVRDQLPYATIVIGVGLVALAIAMLRGYQPILRLPKLQKGTGSRELGSMFLFGVSYAVASLSCTIATFLGVTTATFDRENVVSGVLVFVAYALGMGSLVVFLTIATALAKTSVARGLRRVLPFVHRVSALILLASGLYVAYYGWYELEIRRDIRRDPIVDYFTQRQAQLSNWITDVGATRVGLVLGLVIAAAVATPLLNRRRRHGRVS
jgi:cytochrome c-type biogenesis protein